MAQLRHKRLQAQYQIARCDCCPLPNVPVCAGDDALESVRFLPRRAQRIPSPEPGSNHVILWISKPVVEIQTGGIKQVHLCALYSTSGAQVAWTAHPWL